MEDAYHTDTIPSLREKVRVFDFLFVSFCMALVVQNNIVCVTGKLLYTSLLFSSQ